MAGSGGGVTEGGDVTVTRASATAVPPGPFALALYVTEADGLIFRLPADSTVPMPLSIVTLVAFEDFQDRFVDWPFSIADGDALSDIVGEGAAGSGAGASGSLSTVGVGVSTFLAQPAPKNSNANRTHVKTASMYNDRLIGSLSFISTPVFNASNIVILRSRISKHTRLGKSISRPRRAGSHFSSNFRCGRALGNICCVWVFRISMPAATYSHRSVLSRGKNLPCNGGAKVLPINSNLPAPFACIRSMPDSYWCPAA